MTSEARETAGSPSGTGDAASASRVEEAFASWVAERESGTLPDLDLYLDGLDDHDRTAFRELLAELEETEATLDGPVRPGVVLEDRLEIQRELGEGQGGMGKVFAAFDRKLERQVAVKVLRDHTGGPLDGEGQLRSEALALARLNHANIVAVHDVLTLDGSTCLVMDEVHGVPLADVLDRVRRSAPASGVRARRAALLSVAIGLPAPSGLVPLFGDDDRWCDAVARIALVVCRALEAAHGAGVMHRDLKPRNVMLRGGGSPVVLDFGLAHARTSGRAEPHGRLRGSAAYLAPEQIARERLGDDPRSDVYQVGLLLYEMLVLRPAFTGRRLADVLRRIVRGEVRTPRTVDKGIPFELEAICLRAMERHPDRRYASVSELAADLARFVDRTSLPHAARGGVVASTLRRARYALRRRRTALVAAAAAVLIGLGAAWALRPVEATAPPEVVSWYTARRAGSGWDVTNGAEAVLLGESLGFTIRCDEPRWVYVLSAFGAGDEQPLLAPMPAIPLDGDPDAEREAWGLRVEPGTTDVQCAEACSAGDADPYEGLWVYVAREENAALEAWLNEIAIATADEGLDGVPVARARAAFEHVRSGAPLAAGGRGRALELSRDDVRSLARAIEVARLLGELPSDDALRRYRTRLPLRL